MQGQVGGLQSELGAETRRREEAELHMEEKDAELAGALTRLGEYERVMINVLKFNYHYIIQVYDCAFAAINIDMNDSHESFVCLQGEYGLYEAVQEIKMKKDELAVRDK